MVIKRVIKICIVLLVTGLFCLSFATLGAKTAGYFTDQAVISGNSFQTGDWQAPESQAGPTDEYQTDSDFFVPYTAWDNLSGVVEVKLWYRYEGGAWTYYTLCTIGPPQTSTSGDFDFTASCGDGFYEFYTIAEDEQGNTENPPLVVDTSTTVDTEDPITTISVGEPKYESSLHITSATSITLSAFDATSEVDWTKYRIDAGSWQYYSGPFTLSGLSDGPHLISYQSRDNAGNVEAMQFLVVILDNQGPIISNVQAINITTNSATIIWDTSEGATSSVEYGLDISYGNITPEDPNLVTSHSVDLSGLIPNTLYHFRVKSKDVLGNEAISGDYTFTTLPDGAEPEGHIVINEVYYDVDCDHGAESTNEWIELYNPTNQAVDLSGFVISDNSSSDVLGSYSIPAHSYAVITPNSSTWSFWPDIPAGATKIVLGSYIGNGLGNSGDRVILKNTAADVVDQMGYGTDTAVWSPACPDVSEGHSLARSPAGFDTDSPSDFVDLATPNPGTNPHSQGNVPELAQETKERANEFSGSAKGNNLSNSQTEDTKEKDNKSSDSPKEDDSQKDQQGDNLPEKPTKSKEGKNLNIPGEKNDNQNVEESKEVCG